MNRTIMIAIGLGMTAQVSMGQTFINSLGDTLFRTDGVGGSTTSFTLSAELNSLAVNPATGEIFGASPNDANGNGFRELYRLDNPTGTPSLTLIGDFLTENTDTLSFVEGDLLGIQQEPNVPSATGTLINIDLDTLTQSTIDDDLSQQHAASGYDPATGTLFATTQGNASVAGFFTVPFNNADVVSQFVGNTGQAAINDGGEFFNGTFYHAANVQGGDLVIGTIDTDTGAFTELFNLGTSMNESVGLVVIPAPGAAGVFGVLGLAGLRRRR